jgi:PmbA protein
MEDGILVTELLGLHTINLVSGDFSLGVKGVRIRGGEVGAPVGGMTIAGNLMDLLRSVDLVGSDFKFSGSVGACSMVIRDVAAAGS